MNDLKNPRWLFLINTLPLIVLFLLGIYQFNIVKTLLEPESLVLWKIFGLSLCVVGMLNFLYSLYLTVRKETVSVYYGFVALILYIPFIYLYGNYSDTIVPRSIPAWMVAGDLILYVGTFLMPTLVYSLLIIVLHFTPEAKEYKPWKSFLIAICIPVLLYVFFQVVLPLWRSVGDGYSIHVIIIFVIAGTVLFLFFIIRSIYILATKKAEVWRRYQLFWKIPVALILPIVGLLVNGGLLFDDFSSGVFGDFNNHWFYILAVVNGIAICLPRIDHLVYRFCLFVVRSITFAFTLYFFVVFLPVLPVSVIAIIAFGVGFLILTPLILFVVHVNELSKDFQFLTNRIGKKKVWAIAVFGFFVLPACMTISFLSDRNTINETLDYLYSPDYTRKYDIDRESLDNTLKVIKFHKNRNRNSLFETQSPYISAYFNWIVLDNLTISDAKFNDIEKVFYGYTSYELRNEDIRNENVCITDSNVESVYDENKKVWKSWINLEITNKNSESWNAEYATRINLPAGCWISDYYLYVGDRKEKGILAEKKSAMWIFSEIRNENRDPGILYYLTGNKIAFRVFPFSLGEVRKTGIEFIHKDPVHIVIDGINFQLGQPNQNSGKVVESASVAYIPVKAKSELKRIQRQPYFHFIVDVSSGRGIDIQKYIGRINKLRKEYPELCINSKISKVNSFVFTSVLPNNLDSLFLQEDFTGGFFLDRAIKTTLVDSYLKNDKTYPVMVVVTDSLYDAVLDKDFSDLSITFPENKVFYNLTDSGVLEPHSLMENPMKPLNDTIPLNFYYPCLEFIAGNQQVYYISSDTIPDIVIKSDFVEIDEKNLREKDWVSALEMSGNWISQNLRPERSGDQWLKLVKSSFMTGIMTPVTSYLVVENEAQKEILKKKQEQVLSGNKSLDTGGDAQRMSEPGLILLVMLSLLILYIRKKKLNKKVGDIPLS